MWSFFTLTVRESNKLFSQVFLWDLRSWAGHFPHSSSFPPGIMNKLRPTFGEAWRNAREYLCNGQTSHPGGVAKLPVTSCHRNLDKVRLNGHLSEYRFYLFHYLQCISGKPDNLWCIEGIESWSNNHSCHCDLPGDDLLEQHIVGVTDLISWHPEWRSSESSKRLFFSLSRLLLILS